MPSVVAPRIGSNLENFIINLNVSIRCLNMPDTILSLYPVNTFFSGSGEKVVFLHYMRYSQLG